MAEINSPKINTAGSNGNKGRLALKPVALDFGDGAVVAKQTGKSVFLRFMEVGGKAQGDGAEFIKIGPGVKISVFGRGLAQYSQAWLLYDPKLPLLPIKKEGSKITFSDSVISFVFPDFGVDDDRFWLVLTSNQIGVVPLLVKRLLFYTTKEDEDKEQEEKKKQPAQEDAGEEEDRGRAVKRDGQKKKEASKEKSGQAMSLANDMRQASDAKKVAAEAKAAEPARKVLNAEESSRITEAVAGAFLQSWSAVSGLNSAGTASSQGAGSAADRQREFSGTQSRPNSESGHSQTKSDAKGRVADSLGARPEMAATGVASEKKYAVGAAGTMPRKAADENGEAQEALGGGKEGRQASKQERQGNENISVAPPIRMGQGSSEQSSNIASSAKKEIEPATEVKSGFNTEESEPGDSKNKSNKAGVSGQEAGSAARGSRPEEFRKVRGNNDAVEDRHFKPAEKFSAKDSSLESQILKSKTAKTGKTAGGEFEVASSISRGRKMDGVSAVSEGVKVEAGQEQDGGNILAGGEVEDGALKTKDIKAGSPVRPGRTAVGNIGDSKGLSNTSDNVYATAGQDPKVQEIDRMVARFKAEMQDAFEDSNYIEAQVKEYQKGLWQQFVVNFPKQAAAYQNQRPEIHLAMQAVVSGSVVLRGAGGMAVFPQKTGPEQSGRADSKLPNGSEANKIGAPVGETENPLPAEGQAWLPDKNRIKLAKPLDFGQRFAGPSLEHNRLRLSEVGREQASFNPVHAPLRSSGFETTGNLAVGGLEDGRPMDGREEKTVEDGGGLSEGEMGYGADNQPNPAAVPAVLAGPGLAPEERPAEQAMETEDGGNDEDDDEDEDSDLPRANSKEGESGKSAASSLVKKEANKVIGKVVSARLWWIVVGALWALFKFIIPIFAVALFVFIYWLLHKHNPDRYPLGFTQKVVTFATIMAAFIIAGILILAVLSGIKYLCDNWITYAIIYFKDGSPICETVSSLGGFSFPSAVSTTPPPLASPPSFPMQ